MTQSQDLAVIILAAGLGKRFRSDLPKVLHRLHGRPILDHVLASATGLKAGRMIVVVGHRAEEVKEAVSSRYSQAEFVLQEKRLGTAHAVLCCREALEGFKGAVLVLNGDTPLVTTETLQGLVDGHRTKQADVSLLATRLPDPTGYGRIVRTQDAIHIVEESDASEIEREIDEVSTGIWCFSAQPLFDVLEKVRADNSQGEYYLPDAALAISASGGIMYVTQAADPAEVVGINDRWQLASAARETRMRVIKDLTDSGVTIEDPATTYIGEEVEIGKDTVIRPLTFLEGKVRIGSGCELGPNVRIIDSEVGSGTNITFSVVRESEIAEDCEVGPFASLRPGTRLARGSKVGTFVEVKASVIGEGSKVPHLSYVGDAEIGPNANLGAGTITGNYDNESGLKSKTTVGDGAFTGSGTVLRAPVELGKDSGTGAGAVVTKDVPDGEIVAGVPAKPFRKRKPRREDR